MKTKTIFNVIEKRKLELITSAVSIISLYIITVMSGDMMLSFTISSALIGIITGLTSGKKIKLLPPIFITAAFLFVWFSYMFITQVSLGLFSGNPLLGNPAYGLFFGAVGSIIFCIAAAIISLLAFIFTSPLRSGAK